MAGAVGLEGIGEQFRRGRQEARDLGDEAAGIAADLGDLLANELELAKAELHEHASSLVRAAVWGAIAAVAAMLLLTFAFVAVLFALDTQMQTWAAALVTTGIIALVAAVAGVVAYTRFRNVRVMPEKTISSVREDVRWARAQLKSSSTASVGATH